MSSQLGNAYTLPILQWIFAYRIWLEVSEELGYLWTDNLKINATAQN